MMLWVNPGKAMAGYIALIVPLGLTIFALIVTVMTSWRTWFGLPPKKPKDDKNPRDGKKPK